MKVCDCRFNNCTFGSQLFLFTQNKMHTKLKQLRNVLCSAGEQDVEEVEEEEEEGK